jgi:CRISPR-associated protein Csx17
VIHVHKLDGCAPTPLANYLKALGVFRILSEQDDRNIRGWWSGDIFFIATSLDKNNLISFFLNKYMPTPMLSPWNKGSGFFYPDDPGITPILKSAAKRFSEYNHAIEVSRSCISDIELADAHIRKLKEKSKVTPDDRNRIKELLNFPEGKKEKPSPEQQKEFNTRIKLLEMEKKKYAETEEFKEELRIAQKLFADLKERLIPQCRSQWRGPMSLFPNSAFVIGEKNDPKYPSLFGTGGNDGRFDFTNNYMQRLGDIFDMTDDGGAPFPISRSYIHNSLFGDTIPGVQKGIAVGQFFPGLAGGVNNSTGSLGDSFLNPFDFVLMLEGAVVFTAHSTRRLTAKSQQRAAAPFAVDNCSAGYPSASNDDDGGRGEQWMPLWSQPITYRELKCLFSEGRIQLGRKVSSSSVLDLAQSIANLGTARGISEFQRFGYITRNGDANFAVPLGRFKVPDRVSPKIGCLDDLNAFKWISSVRLAGQTTNNSSSSRLQQKVRGLSNAIIAVTQRPAEPSIWQQLIISMGELEAVMSTGAGFQAGPIPPLRPEWVRAANDNSPEFRLALAFALQGSFQNSSGNFDGIRRHWLPLKTQTRFATSGDITRPHLEKKTDVVAYGRDAVDDAISLIQRRMIESAQNGGRLFPLIPTRGASVQPTDLCYLLAGEVDLQRTLLLARALMALDLRKWKVSHPSIPLLPMDYPGDTWLAIRVALSPWVLPNGQAVGADPAIIHRLESGDAPSAFSVAQRRLRAAGVRTTVQFATVPPETARLWAAALAFPISKNHLAKFLSRLDPNISSDKEYMS